MLYEFPPRLDPLRIDPDLLDATERLVRRYARLERLYRFVLPYGWWRTRDGGCVLFDRHYRPLFRLARDGRAVKCPSDEEINTIGRPIYIHRDMTSPIGDRRTRNSIAIVIAGLRLESEIVRRAELAKRNALPRRRRGA